MDVGETPVLIAIKALLCTGLSMLLVILAKLSTLTHKKAKQIWDPYKKLKESLDLIFEELTDDLPKEEAKLLENAIT